METEIKTIISEAIKADWYNPENADKLLEPIENTWGVNCTILKLTEDQNRKIEEQYPPDTNFIDNSQEYNIRSSANSIQVREHGASINFGYLKFLYHNGIYYIDVAPLVQLTTSLFNQMDDLSHMAKIMLALGEHGRSDRKYLLVSLEGQLTQNE